GLGEIRRDVELAADAGALLELARLPFERGGEPNLVEHLGTQPRGNAAHRVDDAVDRAVERGGLLGARGPGLALVIAREGRDIELESRERLAQVVVDLARDAD